MSRDTRRSLIKPGTVSLFQSLFMHGRALTAHIEILTAWYPEDIFFSLCVDLNCFGIIKTHASSEAARQAGWCQAINTHDILFWAVAFLCHSDFHALSNLTALALCWGRKYRRLYLINPRADPLTPEHTHVHKPVHTCSHISPHTPSPARLEPALNADPLDCGDWLTFKLCNESHRAFLFLCPQWSSWILKLP